MEGVGLLESGEEGRGRVWLWLWLRLGEWGPGERCQQSVPVTVQKQIHQKPTAIAIDPDCTTTILLIEASSVSNEYCLF
jgi:hypothetical protein